MSEQKVEKPTMAQRLSVFPKFEDFQAEHGSKPMAQKIRHLASLQEKEDRGAIAKYLGIRYQWVRNVLIQPVKNKD